MNREERRQKVELYGSGFALLEAALADVPGEAWEYRPAAGEWSIHEIVVHMADSESMAALRARKLIVEPGRQLMGYEEARWADALQYREQSVEDALHIIELARRTTYDLLRKQPDRVFEHVVTHPEHEEPYSFDLWLNTYSGHIPEHIDQIRRALEAWRLAARRPHGT